MSDPSGWHRRTPTPADAARRAEYDSAAYRRERARLGREVKAGRAYCWRCGQHIPPGSKWHTGHIDDRSTVMGAEYAGCNVRTAASKGARTANANRKARKAGCCDPRRSLRQHRCGADRTSPQASPTAVASTAGRGERRDL